MTENARPRKRKIAILGGGIGALTAAFAITEQDGWQEEREVTVYQLGWRLGGKCATGRNAGRADRIEEHGLHVWPGFYENAFQLIRKCYAELGRPPEAPLATWEDAFKKRSKVPLMEYVDGRWRPWPIDFPPNPELPGEGREYLTPWDCIRLLFDWMVNLLDEAVQAPEAGLLQILTGSWWGRLLQRLEAAGSALWSDLHLAHKEVHRLEPDPKVHAPEEHQTILRYLEGFLTGPLRATEEELRLDDDLRRLWLCLELGGAVVRGLIADGVLLHGFDVLDQYDLTEWLQRHGARDPEVWWSAPVRAVYDLVFAFEGGDTARPNLAAGVALRGCLHMFFAYKGAIFWEMQAGMGETVFTPLYEVLRRRGVRFQFFQRVDNLGVNAAARRIDTITLGVQATATGEVLREHGGYQPLVHVKGLACWPSKPLYDQLVEGAELQRRQVNLESAWTDWPDASERTLERGEDFDVVVLGIPVGSLPYLCRELIEADEKWRKMVGAVGTVATQALQLWFSKDTTTLGWPWPGVSVGAYAEPIDTWADMTHLIERESWQEADGVCGISYFCGPLADDRPIPAPFTDPDYPKEQEQRVKDEVRRFLETRARPLWPAATDPANPDGLNWDLLVDGSGALGRQRLDAQFWRANVDPGERYVLSLKGSTASRLPADRSGFDNLYLAGDWVRTRLSAGCVEAAVMAGLQASRGICGWPKTIVGENAF